MAIGRRDLLKAGAGAAIGASMWPRILSAESSRAEKRVRLGFIGVGGRGTWLLRLALQRDDTEIKAVCDVKPDRVFSSETEEETAALVELCAECHNGEAEDFRKAVTELKKREPPLPSCTGCHGSHRVARVRLPHALDDAPPQEP